MYGEYYSEDLAVSELKRILRKKANKTKGFHAYKVIDGDHPNGDYDIYIVTDINYIGYGGMRYEYRLIK